MQRDRCVRIRDDFVARRKVIRERAVARKYETRRGLILDVAAAAFIRTAMHVANTHERTLEDQRVLEHAAVTRSGRF
jgi:hypothetical protein